MRVARIAALATLAMASTVFLICTGQPSADARVRAADCQIFISTKYFAHGDIFVFTYKNRPILIWRRSPAEIARANAQRHRAYWTSRNTDFIPPPLATRNPNHSKPFDTEWIFLWHISPIDLSAALMNRFGEGGGFF